MEDDANIIVEEFMIPVEEMDPPRPAVLPESPAVPSDATVGTNRSANCSSNSNVAVRDHLLYVKTGYQDVPDIKDDPSWYFYKNLAEPKKRKWLRHFVKNNVEVIKDSGWKSLPKLLADAGAPLSDGQSVQPWFSMTAEHWRRCNARDKPQLLIPSICLLFFFPFSVTKCE